MVSRTVRKLRIQAYYLIMEPSPPTAPRSPHTSPSRTIAPETSPSSFSPSGKAGEHSGHRFPAQDALSTRILANNIHCSSCVTRIEEILHGLGTDVLSVSVSILEHEVHVQHRAGVAPPRICAALCNEAFEVSAATTVDRANRVVWETAFPAASAGWWDALGAGAGGPGCMPLPVRGKRKRHQENCVACQVKGDGADSEIDLALSPKSRPEKAAGSLPSPKGKEVASRNDVRPPAFDISSGQPAGLGQRSLDATMQRPKLARGVRRFCATLTVGGMTCASCANAINTALRELDFVQSANVDSISNSAVVHYSGDENAAQKIQETIEDTGFEASLVGVTETASVKSDDTIVAPTAGLYRVTLGVGGMTCASCVNAITDGLRELNYVKKADVALLTNSAEIVVDNKKRVPELVEKIEDLGYDCTLQTCDAVQDEGEKQSSEVDLRHIQIHIDGMFCQHCPPRIVSALEQRYHANITIEKQPTLKAPVMSIAYRPRVPDFTIRHILSSIDGVDDRFKANVFHPPTLEDRSRKLKVAERNRTLLRLLLSALCAIPSLLIGVVWMSLVPETAPMRVYFTTPVWAGRVTRAEWALFVLATPVYFLAADVFHARAVREVRALWRPGSKVPLMRRFYRFGSMNLLISAGTTVAYVSSLALLIFDARSTGSETAGETYFDSVVFLTFFILIGRSLEAFGKSQAGNTVSMLGKLRPQEATLVTSVDAPTDAEKAAPTSTRTEAVPADRLEVGDVVIVPHGASPPADGTITSGTGSFDESSLTGESRAVSKGPDDAIYVGTVNTGTPMRMAVTATGGASLLDQIVAVVREGQTKRAPAERVADVVTAYFVPVITALAIVTFAVWFGLGQSGALDPSYLGGRSGGWAFWSLQFAIAVFVVACPCGIGLAAPTSLFVGCGLAARHGILARGGGEAFQDASDLDAVVFDKTGTLTEGGALKVTDHEFQGGEDPTVCFGLVRALEELSSHPMAKAVYNFASSQDQRPMVETAEVQEVPGLGLRGLLRCRSAEEHEWAAFEAAIGSEALLQTLDPDLLATSPFATQRLETWKSQAKSVAVLAVRQYVLDGMRPWRIAALFATSDPLRSSARSTVQALQQRKIAVYMLSGDNPATARAVAGQLGISVANVFAGVLPTAKADKIRELRADASLGRRRRGGRGPRVAFVGDGINDAPALVAATVSVSLASAAPVAMKSSSFVLLASSGGGGNDVSLAGVVKLLDLSRRVLARVRANFAWALVYNVVLVPVAAGVLFRVQAGGFRLSPVWAAAAMALSSVSVVLSSLALRWERWRFWKRSA